VAIFGPLQHAFCGGDLSLPDSGGRLNIDNDRMIGVDQVVDCVCVEGRSIMSAGVARSRIRL
jgi:hypothetical protein